jgi:hypothetical protein
LSDLKKCYFPVLVSLVAAEAAWAVAMIGGRL